MNKRLDVSPGAGGLVMIKRNRFDSHVSDCRKCQTGDLCPDAQQLWRRVCTTALRTQGGAK